MDMLQVLNAQAFRYPDIDLITAIEDTFGIKDKNEW